MYKLLQALHEWEPPRAPFMISKPDLAGLLSGVAAKGWLRRAVEVKVASRSRAEWATAVGLIGRLWSSCSDAENAEHTARHLSGVSDTPTDRATAWAKEIPLPALQFLEFAGVCKADDLLEELERLQQAVARGDRVSKRWAVSVLWRRDDLESLAFVLRAAGKGQSLLDVLEPLDSLGETLVQLFGPLDIERDERLRSASRQKPAAWWHQV